MLNTNIITVRHINTLDQFEAWLIAYLVGSGVGTEGAYELASDQLIDLAPETCSHCGDTGHLNAHPAVKGLLCDECHDHEVQQDTLDQYEVEEGRRYEGRMNY